MAVTKFHTELINRLHDEYQATKSTENFNTIAHAYGKQWRAGFPQWKPKDVGLELFTTIYCTSKSTVLTFWCSVVNPVL